MYPYIHTRSVTSGKTLRDIEKDQQEATDKLADTLTNLEKTLREASDGLRANRSSTDRRR